jgi:hypothetical protein
MTDEPITLEGLDLRLDKIEKAQVEISKQYTSIQNTLDEIYADRDILVNIEGALRDFKGMIHSSNRKQEELSDDVKQTVELKVEEVKDTVQDKVQAMNKTMPNKILQGIQRTFSKEDIRLEKKSILNRLTSFFRFITVKI